MLIIVTVGAFWQKKRILAKYPEVASSYNALLLALLFVPATFVNPSLMRVVQYFSVYLMVLIPYIIQAFEPKERRMLNILAAFLLIFLMARNAPVHYFYWQL